MIINSIILLVNKPTDVCSKMKFTGGTKIKLFCNSYEL